MPLRRQSSLEPGSVQPSRLTPTSCPESRVGYNFWTRTTPLRGSLLQAILHRYLRSSPDGYDCASAVFASLCSLLIHGNIAARRQGNAPIELSEFPEPPLTDLPGSDASTPPIGARPTRNAWTGSSYGDSDEPCDVIRYIGFRNDQDDGRIDSVEINPCVHSGADNHWDLRLVCSHPARQLHAVHRSRHSHIRDNRPNVCSARQFSDCRIGTIGFHSREACVLDCLRKQHTNDGLILDHQGRVHFCSRGHALKSTLLSPLFRRLAWIVSRFERALPPQATGQVWIQAF